MAQRLTFEQFMNLPFEQQLAEAIQRGERVAQLLAPPTLRPGSDDHLKMVKERVRKALATYRPVRTF